MGHCVNVVIQGQKHLSRAVIAIPAHNEEAWIKRCLTALNDQDAATSPLVILLVNNSTDATAEIARDLRPALSYPLEVFEHQFAPECRNAGQARRMVMQLAAKRVSADGILLCTDADGQVAPNWLSENLAHIRGGADAVAGRAVIDPVDAAAIPAILHQDDARECAYAALLDEIDSLLDPDPNDPWPRHNEHSGASICVTAEAFHQCGGIPALPVGEDRAFFAALRRMDARLRHAPSVWVTVSGRIHGRATGGMADTIRRRLVAPDLFLDDALEPAVARARRASLRRQMRLVFAGNGQLTRDLLHDLGCASDVMEQALGMDAFGRAWELVEAHATRLGRVPVPVTALSRERMQAERLVAALRHDRWKLDEDWLDQQFFAGDMAERPAGATPRGYNALPPSGQHPARAAADRLQDPVRGAPLG